jgi:hypothetical protein
MSRKAEWFKRYFPLIQAEMLTAVESRGHSVILLATWSFREPGTFEKYACRNCRMKVFVSHTPPMGKEHAWGSMLEYDCNGKESKFVGDDDE